MAADEVHKLSRNQWIGTNYAGLPNYITLLLTISRLLERTIVEGGIAVKRFGLDLLTVAACLGAGAILTPIACAQVHVTDGTFTTPNEWTTPTTRTLFFPLVGATGGAYLYVDQGFRTGSTDVSPDTLFLMYDYVHGTTQGSSFFDVFFEVPTDADYLVRIFPTTADSFQAFERQHGTLAPLGSDGSFLVGAGSGWAPLGPNDQALARFHTAMSFGTSPNLGTDHLMAEFELSVNNESPDRKGGNGIYDPDPAFWSASKGGNPDPPFSSGIFTLNPDGSTTVVPVFGPNGGPAQRPQDVVPEPAVCAWLLSSGLVGATLLRRRRA